MTHYPCLKIYQIITLIKKLEKIKFLIEDCKVCRNVKIKNIVTKDLGARITSLEKKNLTKELDHILIQFTQKYRQLHNTLYSIVEEIHGCECCVNPSRICRGGTMCLKPEENQKLWEAVDKFSVGILNFYDEVESKLVLETELCLYRCNQIQRIELLD